MKIINAKIENRRIKKKAKEIKHNNSKSKETKIQN